VKVLACLRQKRVRPETLRKRDGREIFIQKLLHVTTERRECRLTVLNVGRSSGELKVHLSEPLTWAFG